MLKIKFEQAYAAAVIVGQSLVNKTHAPVIFMRRSINFRQGGPGQSDKRSSDNVFFFFFFSPQLILQKSNG